MNVTKLLCFHGYQMKKNRTLTKYCHCEQPREAGRLQVIEPIRASPKYVKCPKKDSVIKVSFESDLLFSVKI